MTEWYAVYTQPRNEGRAVEHLARQNFDVYFPRYLKRRSHARKIEMVPAPLFPRYLFITFDAAAAGWRAIRSTRGVIDVVRNGVDPIAVSSAIVDEIRRREDAEGYVVMERHLDLKRGSRIKIDSGPFMDCEAIFEAQRDEDRVVALLTLLGRKVLTQLPIDSISAAN